MESNAIVTGMSWECEGNANGLVQNTLCINNVFACPRAFLLLVLMCLRMLSDVWRHSPKHVLGEGAPQFFKAVV